MRKRRWMILLIALCAFIPMIASQIMDMNLFAAGTIQSPDGGVANSLHTGDEVHLGIASDDTFSVLGQKDGYLYLLKKNTVGSATNYNTALSNANAYKSEANFGKVGNAHLSLSGNGVSLISKSELQGISELVSNNQIASSINLNGGKWWLKDANTTTNRASFVDGLNMAVDGGIKKTTSTIAYNNPNGGTCSTASTGETGVMPINAFNAATVAKNKYVSSATVHFSFPDAYGMSVTNFNGPGCPNNKNDGKTTVNKKMMNFNYRMNSIGKEEWTANTGGALPAAVMIGFNWRPRPLINNDGTSYYINDSSKTTNFSNGLCYEIYLNNSMTLIDGATNASYAGSRKMGTKTFTMSASISGTPTITTTNCPTLTNAAGSALVRPYVKIKASDVIMRNNAKRAYSASAVLNTASIPNSDNAGSFLTLETSKLSIGLNSGSVGVIGNVYEVEKPKISTIISLPVYFGTENLSEGTRYVSAEAKDVNGDTVYSVLGTVGTGNTANVNIDYANLLKPDTNTFKVTLYLEDSGAGNTSYRSTGTEITVKLKEPQYIRFAANNPATVTYGDKITVNAELYDFEKDANGDIKQSGSDLTFAIAAGDVSKAYIESQSYDPNTGKAQAVVVPLTGTGSFQLSINKNGDDIYFNAHKEDATIQLKKKPLTLVPPIITAVIDDPMPGLEPEALIENPNDGLVSGDIVPTELYPGLERMDVSLAEHPAPGGTNTPIENPGDWKMLFPDPSAIVSTSVSEFMNKYDVTFVDYDDDNDYIFTVDPNGILDRWIEITSPLPKVNGWYRADVTLKPSQEAKYFGYFDIAMVEDGVDGAFGSTVVMTNDTTGIKPTVKLKKNDGEISNPKTLLTKIKIDKEAPTANINVPSGWANLKKTVNIQAIDATSGIDTTDVDSVKVYYHNPNGTNDAITLTNNGGGSYQFDATGNGLYEFIVKDRAGNEFNTFKNITQIDTTPASLTATLGSLSADGDIHDIDVTRVEPDSGINYMQVWFQGDGDTSYSLLGYLNRTLPTQTYQAPMNGRYEFRMKIGTGEELTASVIVADITQIKPVVGMNAINMGDNSAYIDDTWINQDVKITLSNVNAHFTDPITYQYRRISDHDWIDMSDNILDVSTPTWLNELYEFRAVSGDVQSHPVTITIKIDKEKPQPPVMDHPEQLDDDYTFIDKAEISGSLLPKASGISQTWEYSLDGTTWIPVVNDKFEILGAGDYTLQVRTLDEAGNISDIDSYPVHIKGKPTQTIDFDIVPGSLMYGTCDTITAKLTSDLDEQANTPLLFSIPASSMDKVSITSQSYDPDTGIATANICAKSGDVFFDIEISKAGDSQAYPATTKLETIALNKAQLTIYPQIIYGKVVGDAMPTLTSNGTGLVNGDTIPAQFSIVLTPDAGTSDPLPFDAGNPLITHAGTWTMTYPENILASTDPAIVDFAKKYDITLEDYNTKTDYVFTVTNDGIPDSWVIVSPDANADGWNNTDVTLSLSDAATAAGYTSLALIEHGAETLHGATVSLENNTNGMLPVVVLKKGDGTASGYKSLRYVKIDKSLPTATITIADETVWTKTDKKVTIQVSDTYSGVKDIKVTDSAGNDVALTTESANTYSFVSDHESYHLTVTDIADNQNEIDFTVEKIDKTAPTITATLGALSADESHHDVDVEATVGASGVGSFSVYYKEKASDPYPAVASDTLNPNQLSCVYSAYRNGFYLFEIVNGVGEKATAEVEITDVVEVLPIVDIKAELDDGSHTPYANGTWVNQDVIITLSNTNAAISEPITYEYRKVGDTNWTTLDSNKITIEESAWQNEDYEFRGVISTGAGGSNAINVRIDKVKPDIPTIDNADAFTANNAFAAPLTITGSVTAKDSGIGQTIWVSKDHGISDWTEMVGNSLTLTTPDAYALTFKVVDEAGNESDEFTLEDVIVNDGTPHIEIKLNNNYLKDFINKITFGYFFKDHVDVDIEVDWYGMADGDVYYILDDSETSSVPADDDPRWTSGDHTEIDPDRKTMIYAKAVNSDGKIARASSTYFVIADQTPPEITFDKDYTDWISDNSLIASVSDNLSGVNNDTLAAKVDHSDKGNVEVKGSDLHFTNLPDGSYKLLVSGEDNSGNDHSETITVKIDTHAPDIKGVKDQSVYHQYYLPRYISVEDVHSGIAEANITKDGGSSEAITDNITVKDIGTYVIKTKDHAGNEQTLNFEIVALPDIATEIDCSEKSKQIIAQIEQEYEEAKDHMDETELANVEKWLSDARDIRNTCRIKVVYNEDKSAWVEGVGDVDFAIDVVLVVEDIATADLPKLPVQARMAYDVYLMQGNQEIEPDGMVKVHLPYSGTDKNPILYEINDAQKVKEISAKQSDSHLVFEADTLLKYAIAMKEDPSKPSTDIDWDCDGKADLNIDTDGDGKADINIDTNGDGKPNYNVDLDGDGKPDLNIGPVKWNPDKCFKTKCGKTYCTSTYYKPYLNIDTDDDGRPDVNVDLDGDQVADINIDIDGDLIPDIEIDSNGDGKADINLDTTGDGRADTNLAIITVWKPDHNVDSPIKYDTMSGIKVDKTLTPETWQSSAEYWKNKNLANGVNDTDRNLVSTGDHSRIMLLWILFILSALFMSIAHIWHKRLQRS